ncbi:hypothetical protein SAMN03080610_02461 [Afifella marina DSM 2698]|uniref:Uncharacterized protein n=2 Tax=Afifella marina TaxID=1080 RepID=A0A1G5NQ93_AFIMA|nr:hypothetical protein SAMN03080610_02461 [Afifella marina DSM 2698]
MFGKIISYPVYIFYWVMGTSGALVLALSYVNSNDHDGRFRNIYSYIISDPYALWAYEHRYIIVFVCLTMLIIWFNIKLIHERRKFYKTLENILSLKAKFDSLEGVLAENGNNTSELKEHIVSELTHIANINSVVFRDLTGHDCHFSLKTLSGNGSIGTAARSQWDSSNARDRVDSDLCSFDYRKNTAFFEIIEKKKYYFYSNHLILRWICRRYVNANRNWRRYYRACVVTPITSAQSINEINTKNTFGFACIDSKKAYFNNRISYLILTFSTSRCLDVMYRLSKKVRR